MFISKFQEFPGGAPLIWCNVPTADIHIGTLLVIMDV